MVWTRQESLLGRAKRHPYRLRYRTGALADRDELVFPDAATLDIRRRGTLGTYF